MLPILASRCHTRSYETHPDSRVRTVPLISGYLFNDNIEKEEIFVGYLPDYSYSVPHYKKLVS